MIFSKKFHERHCHYPPLTWINNKPAPLTKREQKRLNRLIIKIAEKTGYDADGDIVSFFVHSRQGIVTLADRW